MASYSQRLLEGTKFSSNLNGDHFQTAMHLRPFLLLSLCQVRNRLRRQYRNHSFFSTHSIWDYSCSQAPSVTSVSLLSVPTSQGPGHRESDHSLPDSNATVTLPLKDTKLTIKSHK